MDEFFCDGYPFTGTHHCAMFPGKEHGASQRAFRSCKLNPKHKKFMTVEEFKNKDPSEINIKEEDMPKVWNIIDRTVRIVVSHTSVDRPDTYLNSKNPYPCKALRGNNMWIRHGTGFLANTTTPNREEPPCFCPDCKKATSETPKRERYYFGIKTAAHVVFDTKEAQSTVFELFYDSENRKGIELLYGLQCNSDPVKNLKTDRNYVLCLTHNGELAKRLEALCESADISSGFPCGLLVSHPHGVCKRVSTGRFLQQKFILTDNWDIMKLKKGMKVRFSGCRDTADLIRDINRCLIVDGEPVVGLVEEDESGALEFLSDIGVQFPTGVLIHYSMEGAFLPENISRKDWWRLPSGVELVSSNGSRYKLQRDDDDEEDPDVPHKIEMEVLVFQTLFHYNFSEIFGSDARLYTSSTYDIASCPGSSGAPVFFRGGETAPESCVSEAVHYGCIGDRNASGLDDGWIFQLLHA